ncbi:MAG: ribonucleoside-triphosphate reductase [Candidatus Moranbacteria bacterium CG_4_9_14_3_um_filter_45_14]|nr:MAG: ribonucleoside-triphosphate reductase [Candidatus Moranbacteria bacterium CG_4_9_14_3_um_filter_45_14]
MSDQKTDVEAEAVIEAKRTHCEVWTRVMGYHRPVSHFNIGKKAEHYSRKHFQETVAANNEFCEKYQFVAC